MKSHSSLDGDLDQTPDGYRAMNNHAALRLWHYIAVDVATIN